jgi:Ca2+ transporting ATPase
MDALASLALASEPPTDDLLKLDPVNRSKSIVTSRMWGNMLGHAAYQLAVIFFLLFEGPDVFGLERGDLVEKTGENSIHYTFIFNSFVWMQLFNEFNARSLHGEINVFKGVLNNRLFCGILVVTAALQVIMVEFGGDAMHVAEGGLSGELWGYSIALGAGSLLVQQIINFLYSFVYKNFDMWRSRRLEEQHKFFTRHSCIGFQS